MSDRILEALQWLSISALAFSLGRTNRAVTALQEGVTGFAKAVASYANHHHHHHHHHHQKEN